MLLGYAIELIPFYIALQYKGSQLWPNRVLRPSIRSHGTIEPFDTNLFWSNKHETP
jgi:hypothetical protein